MTRVAVVDLGTNSTRLLVADGDGDRLREVERRLTITRLGEGVDGSRALRPAAVARVADCLAGYRRAAEELGAERALAYATSAVRDAENREAFLEQVESSFGFPTRLLSGEEEALYTFRGVAAGRPIDAPTVVLDIGGGSTEIVLGSDHEILFHTSLDIGCVRLTERFVGSDPIGGCDESLVVYVRTLLRERVPEHPLPAHGIGVAGTVTTLAALDLGLPEEDPELIHGHRLSRSWIAAEARRLAATPVADLRQRRGIAPERAPVIAAGALTLSEILGFFELQELEVSEWDILHGVALELAV